MFKTFKLVVILALLTISFGDKILMEGQLTIVKNPSKPSTEGKSISKPSIYYSPHTRIIFNFC